MDYIQKHIEILKPKIVLCHAGAEEQKGTCTQFFFLNYHARDVKSGMFLRTKENKQYPDTPIYPY